MNSAARVAIVSSGPPISLKVLYCLQASGLAADIIDIGGASITRYSRYKGRYTRVTLNAKTRDIQDYEASIIRCLTQRDYCGVVPADVASAGRLYELASQLPGTVVFPVSAPRTLEMLDNKWQFAEFLRNNNIGAPQSALLESSGDVERVMESGLAFPLVVKSLYGESSHGVAIIKHLDALRKYLSSGSPHARLPLVIQEYFNGVDADISVLAQNGVIHAHVLQFRRREDVIEFGHNEKALELATRIVRAARYSGVANIDVRINEASGEVKVIECNPRFWYTLQASLWRGINFVTLGLDLARGLEVSAPVLCDNHYYYHGYIVKNILFRPDRWRTVPSYNWRGFFQALSDPMPFVSASKQRMRASAQRETR